MTTSQVADDPVPPWVVKWLAAPRVRYLLFMLLALVYAGCIGYLWVRGVADLFDFNAYYMAAYAFSHDVNIYTIGSDASVMNWQELAAAAGVEHYSTPFRYPPFIAQLVLPLLRFSPFAAGMTG